MVMVILNDVLPENWTIPKVMPQLHRGPLCGLWVSAATTLS
jgi:hypothetical protein